MTTTLRDARFDADKAIAAAPSRTGLTRSLKHPALKGCAQLEHLPGRHEMKRQMNAMRGLDQDVRIVMKRMVRRNQNSHTVVNGTAQVIETLDVKMVDPLSLQIPLDQWSHPANQPWCHPGFPGSWRGLIWLTVHFKQPRTRLKTK